MKDIKPLKELLDSVRDIEGFPIGRDEDILELSDPPFYTACPNLYVTDFTETCDLQNLEYDENYKTKKPFMGDLAYGRKNSIYNLHSYHTKVPPEAIERYIEHFTKEGDTVLDGFCGTGMTGVAANNVNRKAILMDLSPIASFIAYSNCNSLNCADFLQTAWEIIDDIYKECKWLYDAYHYRNGKKINAEMNYMIWSDVYACPYCRQEYVYWDAFVKNNKTLKSFTCLGCAAEITKNESLRVHYSYYDDVLEKEVLRNKQEPVKISYIYGKKKILRNISDDDVNLNASIENRPIPYWFPSNQYLNKGIKWGDTWRAGYHEGITNTHHFYTRRNIWVLSAFYDRLRKVNSKRIKNMLLYLFTSLHSRSHRMNRYIPDHNRHVGPLSGTLYVSFLQVEINVFQIIKDKLRSFQKACGSITGQVFVSTQSISGINNMIPENSIDYVFTDPPFGSNLMYSELNYILESWLKVITNNSKEAIINESQNKDISSYKQLMIDCFYSYYKVLKPNRWMTVVFHNSSSAIWNTIQEAITKAGFVISKVNILDKKKGTTKQLTYSNTTKNDLVINAYKPPISLSKNHLESSGKNLELEFLKSHLDHLNIEPGIERTEKMLYSKLLAYYITKGYVINYDAMIFYKLLKKHFSEEDGFWFIENQIEEYHNYKLRLNLDKTIALENGQFNLFISDEKSALTWLESYLSEPREFSTISVSFNKVANMLNDEVPDIRDLLEKNFVIEDGKYRQPKTESEKSTLIIRRSKELLREFELLLLDAKGSRKKIKQCRKQAVVFGFEYCYRNERFQDILDLANKLDRKIIENDSEISEFIEIAQVKIEGF